MLRKCGWYRPLKGLPPEKLVFEVCPDCNKEIGKGYRTDMCPFCMADFSRTKRYKAKEK